jgi:hypothetical protein
MALSTVQMRLLQQEQLDNQLVNVATEIQRYHLRWKQFSEFLNDISANNGRDLGYTDGTEGTVNELAMITSYRTALATIVAAMEAEDFEDFLRPLVV